MSTIISEDYGTFVEGKEKAQHSLHEKVQTNIKTAQEKMSKAFEKKATKKYRHVEYKEGDEVLLLNMRKKSRKGGRMEPDYSGPYLIQELLGKTVSLKTMEGVILKTKYNTSHLKPYKRSRVRVEEAGPGLSLEETPTCTMNAQRESVIMYVGKRHVTKPLNQKSPQRFQPPPREFSHSTPRMPAQSEPSIQEPTCSVEEQGAPV